MANLVLSGHIPANAGFSSPAPFPGPVGWTVFKKMQAEIYEITHNLHLKMPPNQLQVVVTPARDGVLATVTSSTADTFTVTLRLLNTGPVACDFDFVAVYNKKPLKG
jgi:hypothetical protein